VSKVCLVQFFQMLSDLGNVSVEQKYLLGVRCRESSLLDLQDIACLGRQDGGHRISVELISLCQLQRCILLFFCCCIT
jgi:hypothetical protein